jgi:hypothetical protein
VFFKKIANLGEVAGRGFSPANQHLGRIPAVNQLLNFAVVDELASFSSGDSFFDLVDKPLVITHEFFHRFRNEPLSVKAAFRGKAREFRFQLGT